MLLITKHDRALAANKLLNLTLTNQQQADRLFQRLEDENDGKPVSQEFRDCIEVEKMKNGPLAPIANKIRTKLQK